MIGKLPKLLPCEELRVVSTACNAGGCSDSGSQPVDAVYQNGRKVLSVYNQCSGGYVYGVGECAC